MLFFGKLGLAAGLLLLLIGATGCLPTDSSQVDDEREPHYVLGKNCVNARDYTGAIEAFQEALEANPHSAAAHFQLACLYDSNVPDPAAAIYHFQEYIRLNPEAGNAEVIRQRIYSCKQQLAADVMPMPSAPAAEKQLEALVNQNRQLQQKVDGLNDQIRQWNAYYAAEQAAAKAQPVQTSQLPEDVSPVSTVNQSGAATATAITRTANPGLIAPVTHLRTHTVTAGETLAVIARRAGVSVEQLESVNPRINPKRIRAGQVVNLPPE